MIFVEIILFFQFAANQMASQYGVSDDVPMNGVESELAPSNGMHSTYFSWNFACCDLNCKHFFLESLDQNAAQGTNEEDKETNSESSSTSRNRVIIKKLAEEDKEQLLTVAQSYQISSGNNISVRPWIPEDYAKKSVINIISQFALYKCMHAHCIFATDDSEIWERHMEKHQQLIDVCQNELYRGNLTKVRRDELIKFRECAYCSELPKTQFQVMQHMGEDHRQSILQCTYCYYRTIETDNIVHHYETCHPEEAKEILMCGESREYNRRDEDIRNECEQYVDKIVCGQGNKL